MVESLIDKIYMEVGGRVYQRIVDILKLIVHHMWKSCSSGLYAQYLYSCHIIWSRGYEDITVVILKPGPVPTQHTHTNVLTCIHTQTYMYTYTLMPVALYNKRVIYNSTADAWLKKSFR